MTDKEIVQVLRVCASGEAEDCPFTAVAGCDGCPKVSADLIERLTAENAALRAQIPQWISVEDADRRAPAGQRVVATDGVFVGEAYRTSADSWRRYDDYRLWHDATGRTVTHWMLLPEAPEG